MIFFRKLTLFIILFWLGSHIVTGQNRNNWDVIKNIYEQLQNKHTKVQELLDLTSNIRWDTETTDDRYTISFYGMITNQWQQVLIKNIHFTEIEKNKIRVTGTVTGLQRTECVPITNTFTHLWELDKGIPVKFSEYATNN